MPKSLFTKLIEGYRQKKLLLYTTYVLSKMGILIIPFYLTQESPQDNLKIKISSKYESIACGFLPRSDIEKIYNHPETREYAQREREFINDNCLCFGLKQNDEIMAFMWCNLRRCHINWLPLNLQDNEAYLFSAYTYNKYRGMNLAPYLRYQFYKALHEIGRTRFLSLTEYFNSAAVSFKKKLNAKHVKLSIYVRFFSRFHRTFTLKRYSI
jgi:Acetyltransferase (GNAT) family